MLGVAAYHLPAVLVVDVGGTRGSPTCTPQLGAPPHDAATHTPLGHDLPTCSVLLARCAEPTPVFPCPHLAGRWVEVEQDGERFWYNKVRAAACGHGLRPFAVTCANRVSAFGRCSSGLTEGALSAYDEPGSCAPCWTPAASSSTVCWW